MQDYEEYEYQMCEYHINNTNQLVWHWKYIPEEHLFASGFIMDYNSHRLKRKERIKKDENNIREYGLDGLALDNNGVYHGLQAKCWDSKKYLTASDLGSFLSVIFTRLMPKNQSSIGYLYHTCRLQIEVRDSFTYNPNLIHNLLKYNNKIGNGVNILKNQEIDYKLYLPQEEALIELKKGWENIGLISMPCALGKTVLLGNYIRDIHYKNVIILSPLRILTKQMLDRIHLFIPDKSKILVDSDEGGTTNVEKVIRSFENPCLMSITYESFLNIFIKYPEINIENSLIVIDEAHNLIHYQEIMDYLNNKLLKTLLLTATPTDIMIEYLNCDIIYYYPMSEAIKNNYICDYLINVPILDLDTKKVDIDIPYELKHLDNDITLKCLFLLSGMLETGSRRCIVYCCSIEECEIFNKIFTEISIEYHGINCWTNSITANTFFKKREEILNDFQNNTNKISILSSVRIMNEGINVIKCDSIFITKINNNEIVAVQRMCRANRKNKENPNKIANCFIWSDDLDKTVEMLQFLKTNDDTNFFNKIIGRSGNYEKKGNLNYIKKDIDYTKTLREYISVQCISIENKWIMQLKKIEKYIDENKKRPSIKDINDSIKKMGIWISNQQINYSKNKHIMKIPNIQKLWEEFIEKYNEYFISNEELWKDTIKKVAKYIDENKKKPSQYDKNNTIKKLGKWIIQQQINYLKKQNIMKILDIQKLWEEFIEKYNEYVISKEELWKDTMKKVEEYINKNKKRPSDRDKNYSIKKLGIWINTQQINYLRKQKIIKNLNIQKLWEEFIEKYNEYFISNEEQWKNKIQEVTKYINENKKRPSNTNKNNKIQKLAAWINTQQINYSKKQQIMKNLNIQKLWEEFIEKYNEYFISNEELWKNIIKKVEKYIDENKKRPSSKDINDSIKKMGNWINAQQNNYLKKQKIMKNPDIQKLWEEFLEKYNEYLFLQKI